MKANELIMKEQGFRFNTNEYPQRSKSYKFLMQLGRAVPTTKAQCEFFKWLDVLNKDDVNYLEKILNKHNYKGNYKYTKSKHWVRIINIEDVIDAFKKEYIK